MHHSLVSSKITVLFSFFCSSVQIFGSCSNSDCMHITRCALYCACVHVCTCKYIMCTLLCPAEHGEEMVIFCLGSFVKVIRSPGYIAPFHQRVQLGKLLVVLNGVSVSTATQAMQYLSTYVEFGYPSCPGTLQVETGHTHGAKNCGDHRLIKQSHRRPE